MISILTQRQERAAQMFAEGVPRIEIARSMGITLRSLRMLLARARRRLGGGPFRVEFDWTDDAVARLKWLWAEGVVTREIGKQLGVSKNAAIGKAHRLGLPARPSPIHDDSGRVSQQ